eukprot:6201813-Pleurochrysis_carterae.AAC.4
MLGAGLRPCSRQRLPSQFSAACGTSAGHYDKVGHGRGCDYFWGLAASSDTEKVITLNWLGYTAGFKDPPWWVHTIARWVSLLPLFTTTSAYPLFNATLAANLLEARAPYSARPRGLSSPRRQASSTLSSCCAALWALLSLPHSFLQSCLRAPLHFALSLSCSLSQHCAAP